MTDILKTTNIIEFVSDQYLVIHAALTKVIKTMLCGDVDEVAVIHTGKAFASNFTLGKKLNDFGLIGTKSVLFPEGRTRFFTIYYDAKLDDGLVTVATASGKKGAVVIT